jgi:inosine-uridine nucleoside N-ribohydrolase
MLEPDLLAAAAALEPETVTGSERHVVEVALGDPLTRGQSVVDWYKRSKRPGNVEVVLSMDTGRVWEMVRDALA